MRGLLGNKTTTISKLVNHSFRWYAVAEAHSRPPPAIENRRKIGKFLDLIKAGKGLSSLLVDEFCLFKFTICPTSVVGLRGKSVVKFLYVYMQLV